MIDWFESAKEYLARILWVAVCLIVAAIGIALSRGANATWKPEYASAPQAVQDWYKNAQLTPQARARLNWVFCCDHADVVKTKFRYWPK